MEQRGFAFIKSDKKFIKLFFDTITIIKGSGNYVEIYTTFNKRFVYYKSMKDIIKSLPNEFMRVHNSYIVNLINVEYYEDNQISINNLKITVAKSYRDCLIGALNKRML